MSHVATNWASRARGIQPAQKLILFFLADYHTPDFGCEIDFQVLADQTEISVSDLEAHVAELARAGWVTLGAAGRIWLSFETGFPSSDGRGVTS